jgi:hypothetical protein
VPITADDVVLEKSSYGITDGLDQSAVTLASLTQDMSHTGATGTPTAYLQIKATTVKIGVNNNPGTPAGPSRFKLDTCNAQSAITIFNTKTALDNDQPPVRLLCNHADTTLDVRKGKVGVAIDTGETSTLSKITIGYVSQKATDADVYIGSGVTLATLDKRAGKCLLNCGVSGSVTNSEGKLTTEGAGTIPALNVKGGEVTANSTGTITTVDATGGTTDFTKSSAARTVDNTKIGGTATIKLDPSVTHTNGIIRSDANSQLVLKASAA